MMQALGINAGNLFVNVCCFAIAFFILVKFVVGPVQNMLEKRRAVIEKGLEDAKAASDARIHSENEREQILREARSEAAKMIEEARQQAETAKQQILDEGRERIESELREARQSAADERDKMLAEMRPQITDLALSCAQKMVGESLYNNDDAQRAVLGDIINGMAAASAADLSQLKDDLKHTEIISAVPLTEAEKSRLIALWRDQSGEAVNPVFNVDPSILGGLRFRAGSAMLDLSVAEKAADLRRALMG